MHSEVIPLYKGFNTHKVSEFITDAIIKRVMIWLEILNYINEVII